MRHKILYHISFYLIHINATLDISRWYLPKRLLHNHKMLLLRLRLIFYQMFRCFWPMKAHIIMTLSVRRRSIETLGYSIESVFNLITSINWINNNWKPRWKIQLCHLIEIECFFVCQFSVFPLWLWSEIFSIWNSFIITLLWMIKKCNTFNAFIENCSDHYTNDCIQCLMVSVDQRFLLSALGDDGSHRFTVVPTNLGNDQL